MFKCINCLFQPGKLTAYITAAIPDKNMRFVTVKGTVVVSVPRGKKIAAAWMRECTAVSHSGQQIALPSL